MPDHVVNIEEIGQQVERVARRRPKPGSVVKEPSAMPYTWAGNLAGVHQPRDLVQGVLSQGAMAVLYGESGSGKTYLALDMSASIAAGIPWLGRKTKPGAVLYVAAEAGPSIENRILAWRNAHPDVEGLLLAVVTIPVDLRDGAADTLRIVETARRMTEECMVAVVLIVIDTLSRAFAGGNENASEDMGALVTNSDHIRSETGAAVLWVHHAGKDTAKGARGHSLLRAASDTEIEVTNRDGIVVAKVTKQRDGPGGDELAAKLRPVVMGVDSFGDPMSVCIVESTMVPAAAKAPPRRDVALEALREALTEHGETSPGTSTLPKGARIVQLDTWRQRWALRTGYADSTQDSIRVNFNKDKDALLKAGKVGICAPWVWTI